MKLVTLLKRTSSWDRRLLEGKEPEIQNSLFPIREKEWWWKHYQVKIRRGISWSGDRLTISVDLGPRAFRIEIRRTEHPKYGFVPHVTGYGGVDTSTFRPDTFEDVRSFVERTIRKHTLPPISALAKVRTYETVDS